MDIVTNLLKWMTSLLLFAAFLLVLPMAWEMIREDVIEPLLDWLARGREEDE